jgi:hypothetical protein
MSRLLKQTGFFDCREYKKGTKRNERKMVATGSRINFSVGFLENELTDEIREFATLHEKSGKWFASFKVFPKNCKAYNAGAKEIEFPSNEKLDGGQFEVNVDFGVKHGTGTELNGLYVNRIQFIKKVDTAFDAVEDGDENMFSSNVVGVSITLPPSEKIDENNTGLPF